MLWTEWRIPIFVKSRSSKFSNCLQSDSCSAALLYEVNACKKVGRKQNKLFRSNSSRAAKGFRNRTQFRLLNRRSRDLCVAAIASNDNEQ